MTQSVIEKTSIPEKTWRRQTDSPFGWITFACGSVILHLLAFWLIGSYKLSASQSGSASAVPIEFIEISPQNSSQAKPQPKPKPKPVTSKPTNNRTNQAAKPFVAQNPKPAANPSAVKPPISTNDRDAIAFNQKIEQQLAEQQRQQELLQQQQLVDQQRQLEAQQRQREVDEQRQLEAQQRLLAEQLRRRVAQQSKLEAQLRQQEQEQQRQLALRLRQQEAEQKRQLETQLQQEAEQKRQLEIQSQQEEEQKRQLETQRQQEAGQRRLSQQSKVEAEEQRKIATEQQLQNPAEGEKILDGPKNADGEEPPPEFDKKTAQAPIPNQPNQSGGILTASWKIDTKTFKEKPDNLAQPLKRINSDIPLPPPQDGNFQPGSFLVWLTIDNQGNLISVEVDKQIPLAQRSQYQEYAEKIFNGQKFIPASESNGSKPPLSYLPIIINIQEN